MEDDDDHFCGDAEWEFTLAAVAWEARRKLYAEALIKEGEEEAALTHIRFLFWEEEEQEDSQIVNNSILLIYTAEIYQALLS